MKPELTDKFLKGFLDYFLEITEDSKFIMTVLAEDYKGNFKIPCYKFELIFSFDRECARRIGKDFDGDFCNMPIDPKTIKFESISVGALDIEYFGYRSKDLFPLALQKHFDYIMYDCLDLEIEIGDRRYFEDECDRCRDALEHDREFNRFSPHWY